jgi:hypothetical protein
MSDAPPENPCPVAKTYQASNGRNTYSITVTITAGAWNSLPLEEKQKVRNVMAAAPISVMPNLSGKGNGIKRESNGWTIHTQSDKSLYDTNITTNDAGKKTFVFDTYKKRPH